MAQEIPDALTKERIIAASGRVDFSPRIKYVTDGLFPKQDKLASIVGVSMGIMIEPIEDGALEVPEEVGNDRFEFWLAGLAVKELVRQSEMQQDG